MLESNTNNWVVCLAIEYGNELLMWSAAAYRFAQSLHKEFPEHTEFRTDVTGRCVVRFLVAPDQRPHELDEKLRDMNGLIANELHKLKEWVRRMVRRIQEDAPPYVANGVIEKWENGELCIDFDYVNARLLQAVIMDEFASDEDL